MKRSNLAEGEGDEHIRWGAFHFHWKEKIKISNDFKNDLVDKYKRHIQWGVLPLSLS